MAYTADMPAKTGKTTQIVVRIEHDLDARIDALVAKLSKRSLRGMTPLRKSDVIRAAIFRGVAALEEDTAKKAVKK